MRTRTDLLQMQACPLEVKVLMTQRRIREWVTEFGVDGVYISFSGGKDSTVLLHLVRELYPDIEAVFVNTGLEFPEIQKFVRKFDNVRILTPKMNFKQVISKYGYPILSKDLSKKISAARRGQEWALKYLEGRAIHNGELSSYNVEKYLPLLSVDFLISHKCCDVMKKQPAHEYEKKTDKKPMVATMAEESKLRFQAWLKTGCNSFNFAREISKPMSFWTEQDVLKYIKDHDLPLAEPYGEIIPINGQFTLDGMDCKLCTTGQNRTGCVYCAFGAHLEKGESRFERLKRTHPKQYKYCIGGGGYDNEGLWKPNDQGLGMGHVFDVLNNLYGKDFIRY